MMKSITYLIGLLFFSVAQASVQSYLAKIKNDSQALYKFFKSMPKGGELHYHLAGGARIERMLELASIDNYCLNTQTMELSKKIKGCSGIHTQNLAKQVRLYEKVLKSWSMKDFIPGVESGHDHFFNTFSKFAPLLMDHRPELIADVMQTAAEQKVQYLELMILPDNGKSADFADLLKQGQSFRQKTQRLLTNKDFQQNIAHTVAETERILKKARQFLGCENHPKVAPCQVKIKFQYYSLREQPLDKLFAQTLNAFAAVAQSQKQGGNLVGVNLVQAEDGLISLRDYHQHMQIYAYLHRAYPQVNISLHAGELTPALVKTKELYSHIHEAVFIAQAQRIGHGVDISHEYETEKTLSYMAKHRKVVEINLTSNLKILNCSGANHPLPDYLKHGVPVVLSTDDAGILETDLTQQYVEAIIKYHLDYRSIKQINRNALSYAFLSGKSIWADANQSRRVPECQELNSKSCKEFIKHHQKAQLQWQLEKKLSLFENRF